MKHRAKRNYKRRNTTKTKKTRRAKKAGFRVPRTADQFFAMSKQAQDEWTNATSVISEMRRRHISLRQASREANIDDKVVRKLVGTALRKQRNGRYVARRRDKLLRVFVIPSRKGLREIATRDSREASRLSSYSHALDRYTTLGDSTLLREFKGQKIADANGKKIPLLTNLAELDRLASAGVLSFETIYAKR